MLVAAGGWHDESPGGANKLPTDFARFLARQGHDVVYVCPSATLTGAASSRRLDGVDLWQYAAPAAPSPSPGNVRAHLTSVRRIVSAVVAERGVRTLLGHSQLQYLAAARVCGSRVRRCFAVHSPFSAELKETVGAEATWKHRIAWLGADWIERRLLQMSDVVHCDSSFTRTFMMKAHPRVLAPPGKTLVLPGWVDTDRFRPARLSKASLRTRLGAPWSAHAPTFFTLRRLVPRMGIDALVDAAALLACGGHGFRVVIGGDGPERPRLEARARDAGVADRIAFIGRIPDDQLADTFAAADCFVLPTRSLECFGLIVLESYACGVPVIGVPVGSIPEVMGSMFAGWIANDNRPEAIARRMLDVLQGRLHADPERLRARALEFETEHVALKHARVLLGEGRAEASPADGTYGRR